MTIAEIKTRLSLLQVLSHYRLRPDRNNRLRCPWHDDKTPSLQIYPQTNTWTCFSGKCTAGSGDQIDFIMKYEKISKHEALLKATELAGTSTSLTSTSLSGSPAVLNRTAVLTKYYQGSLHAMERSQKGRDYAATRGLDHERLKIGYCGYGVGKTWEKDLQDLAGKMGLYNLRNCLIFPTKDRSGRIASVYGRSTGENPRARHFYLAGGFKGLYPGYPEADVRQLILTESIIDAASIVQHTDYAVLALYGTNGFTGEHEQAVKTLAQLEEVILFFDGDEAGRAAAEKYAGQIAELRPGVKISRVATPQGEDPNSLIQGHEGEILKHLVENRSFFSSVDTDDKGQHPNKKQPEATRPLGVLNTDNPEILYYQTAELNLTILGGIKITGLDRLRVTLKIEKRNYSHHLPIRHGLDLYHSGQVDGLCEKIAAGLEVSSATSQKTISELTGALEQYRHGKLELLKPKKTKAPAMTEAEKAEALQYLKSSRLLRHTLEDIAGSGIVGEGANALIAYLCYSSRKQERPLHILYLGPSGSGKTYLQEKVSALIPEEDKIEITSLSDNAFYYFGREELKGKLILIEDLDGAENVLYPLRELQTKRRISKTVTLKDGKGNLKTITLRVEGPVCVSGCTTRERIYEDNANRSILLYIDGSPEQDRRIMDYQKGVSSGQVDHGAEGRIKARMQNVQRLLRPLRVVNPYAGLIDLPPQVFKPRRTLLLLLSFIEAVTFYHQYQRQVKTDESGRPYIESSAEDVQAAFSLMKEVLFSKSDELSKAGRQFLEKLKGLVKAGEVFYTQDIRKQLRLSSSAVHRYVRELKQGGYLKHRGGNRFAGYEYEICDYEEYDRLKSGIDQRLQAILAKIQACPAEGQARPPAGQASQYPNGIPQAEVG